ncbi:(Na+)-NQR maturation NqrM [Neisseria oralis]|uniref:(Na+)-NQR maturation NqrM n=1 Tax=Neisseria oralis TaxID=1107316 RepID=A0ABW8Q4B0_9NEIS
MYTILLTFGFFLLIILGMSVGYIFSKRTIKGSCGGISSLGMKKVCDCETPCDTLPKRLDKQNAAKSISVDR